MSNFSQADLESNLLVLLYHGVTTASSTGIENCSGKHIHASVFEAQMEYLKENCSVLSVDEALDFAMRKKQWPKNSAVISFDDGFANNPEIAAPILEEISLPAVFYFSAGMINTDLMFWVDILEDSIGLCGVDELSIHLSGEPRVFDLRNPQERIDTLNQIKAYCKKAPQGEKDWILKEVSQQTGIQASPCHAENYRIATWEQVRTMARNDLFTLGGHSLYHDVLASQPLARMQQDVALSIDLMAYHLDQVIIHYAYPEGQKEHYSSDVIDALIAKGIVCSPSAVHGLNPAGADPFHWKRVMVGFAGCDFPYPLS